MSHPRVEEVEDSDIDMSDPSEGDIDDFADSDIIRTRNAPSKQQPPSKAAQQQPPQSSHVHAPPAPAPAVGPTTTSAADAKAYAHFQCLYPIYFDARRSRAEGRRVPRDQATTDPLAREIVNACRDLRLRTLFEPEKTHPKDWANPGRVKVALRDDDDNDDGGGGGSAGIKNKHQLYVLVARHLREHPTTAGHGGGNVLWERIPGGPPPPDANKPYPRPAVPRGWKMGGLVPYWSPAMTGGGVSENLFKDMMKEMQQGGGGGAGGGIPGMDMASLMGAMGGGGGVGGGGLAGGNASEDGGGKKKKDKKGKGKA